MKPTTPTAILAHVGEALTASRLVRPTEQHFQFWTFYHPYTAALVSELNRHGVDALLHRPLHQHPAKFAPTAPGVTQHEPLDFEAAYAPDEVPHPIVADDYPQEDVDFGERSAYGIYNWELFFHAPLLIADRLRQNQRF